MEEAKDFRAGLWFWFLVQGLTSGEMKVGCLPHKKGFKSSETGQLKRQSLEIDGISKNTELVQEYNVVQSIQKRVGNEAAKVKMLMLNNKQILLSFELQ